MGERALENRIRKLKEIESQQEQLTEKAEKLREEIKTHMRNSGTDEIQSGGFVVRLKEVISTRFDSKSFKADHKGLYAAYAKPQSSFRFTVH